MNKKQAERLRAAVTLAAQDDLEQQDNLDNERPRWRQSDWAGIHPGALLGRRDEIEAVGNDEGSPQYVVPVTCGTHGCIAGWISMAAGDKLLIDEYDLRWALEDGDRVTTSLVLDQNGRQHRIRERASALLGLSETETDGLFHADNTLDDVVERANRLLTEHGHEPIDIDDLIFDAQGAHA